MQAYTAWLTHAITLSQCIQFGFNPSTSSLLSRRGIAGILLAVVQDHDVGFDYAFIVQAAEHVRVDALGQLVGVTYGALEEVTQSDG